MQYQKPLCFVKNVRNLAFDAVCWSIHTLHKTHKTALNRALWFSRGNHSLLTSLCVKLSLLCGEEFVGKSRLAAWAQARTHHTCVHTHISHIVTHTQRHIPLTQSHTHTHRHTVTHNFLALQSQKNPLSPTDHANGYGINQTKQRIIKGLKTFT